MQPDIGLLSPAGRRAAPNAAQSFARQQWGEATKLCSLSLLSLGALRAAGNCQEAGPFHDARENSKQQLNQKLEPCTEEDMLESGGLEWDGRTDTLVAG